MDLWELRVFLTVAAEGGFSRAAAKLYRTQPAISQTIRRLETELGERLFDRASKGGILTAAGRLLQTYAAQVLQLVNETEAAIRQLHEQARAVVIIGANEAAVPPLLPIIAGFRKRFPNTEVEVIRIPAKHIASEIAAGTINFGVLATQRVPAGLQAITIASDELLVLVHPAHHLARRAQITIEEFQKETIIAHNDPSPAREHVLRFFATRQLSLHPLISLPSLDAIKRAVEMRLGVALLPRRCALTEIADGRLVAVPMRQLSRSRAVRLVYRDKAQLPQAANSFLKVASEMG
ncbi:MAG: LysR family transcriptional regulator [Acidobacteria bacterium]|nr:LysR family transcriptional regulator [Acidobacteriota bacterium]